jgi:acyl carrier protein
VRTQLAQQLPSYMLPAAIVVLDTLPLTVNGKLNTRALPAPEYTTTGYRAPTDPLEQTLAAIYAHILGVHHVGIDDSFFDLGGHSLLAMRLVARIRAELDIELPVQTIFDQPTIATLAPTIRPHTQQPTTSTLTGHSSSLSEQFGTYGARF